MSRNINLYLLTIFFVLFSLSTLVLAVDCPIPDTGQTKCYDATQEITCPSPGDPFYGQDAQYLCNPQSYAKIDANGNDLPDEATEWVMIRDNVTGLIWENKTDDGSIHDVDDEYTWQDAQDVFIATLKSQNFGGHNDWRLPTVKELSTIIDSSIPAPGPTINTDYFPNTESSYYWSSTTYANDPIYAWLVFFGGGYLNNGPKYPYGYVRAVRSGQCGSFHNFIDNGDGTVTDTDTGLMWQKDTAPGTYTWEQALSYCESSTLAGYNDWRLPNRNELQSIVDYGIYNPSIDPVFYAVSSTYWSSTTEVDFPGGAWYVRFDDGYLNGYGKFYGGYHVRAVRGGQCESLTTTTTSIGSITTSISGSTTTTVTPCPTEEIYGEHSEETKLLRYLRDNVLSPTPGGQEIIRLYYEWSPAIIKAMEENEEFKVDVKEMMDGVLPLIREVVE